MRNVYLLSTLAFLIGLNFIGCTSIDTGSNSVGVGEGLGVGSPAPQLNVAEWMTGKPVESIEPGKVYVIEFWATWCGPCKANMPHIAKLQDKYGDKISIVGISNEDSATVNDFLNSEQSPVAGKTWSDVITYSLAVDNDNAMNEAYMEAANQSGIPCAFLVGKDSKIRWIGHPSQIDRPLAAAVAE